MVNRKISSSKLQTTNYKLVVIVGPTASGKSDLSMRLARQFNGEIICADSLTIFKNMDIGTAKPTTADQKAVPHWGLDLIGPGKRFTAADFKAYAEAKIKEIQGRGKLPVIVGGTGLYVDALVFDFDFVGGANSPIGYDPIERGKLDKLSIDELQAIIDEKHYPMPENSRNRRYLIRTIERKGRGGSKTARPPRGFLLTGLLPQDDILKQKIGLRVEEMFEAGLVEETAKLLKQYGRESLLAKAKVAYGPVVEYLSGQLELKMAKDRLKVVHWQYARRQKTWFKRNPHTKWFNNSDKAFEYISEEVRPWIKNGKTF